MTRNHTIKTLAVTALFASLWAPAVAGTAEAIARFNMDLDAGDRTVLSASSDTTVKSTRTAVQARAYRQFNLDADTTNDLRGTQGITTVSGMPSHGAPIFMWIEDANAEDE